MDLSPLSPDIFRRKLENFENFNHRDGDFAKLFAAAIKEVRLES
jgi:hypothetical protein